ncbi:MAG: helix-turn-helix transcriptional regulator [Lachnospiraceae bacterium]|nr:helix-turn-helix transcriptional regulator [Lachnospiraceae bacterium]MBR3004311.1 helix-turn-helix transcriptional regulator [Lachnospiraceae bacterium]MBR6349602.1 helix-turn-helix transcriptional regulator [Lachnospiraceae bacterium]
MDTNRRVNAYINRIREIREEHNLTQRAVAAYLHVVTRTYCDYESGRIRMPIDRMIRLAKYYNVSMDYITGLTNVRGHFPG